MKERDDCYQTAVIELETISPIHIRGKEINYGEGLLQLESQKGSGFAYLVDNDALAEWLYEIAPGDDKFKYINDYAIFFTDETLDGFFKRYGNQFNISEFVKKNRENLEEINEESFTALKSNPEKRKDCFTHNEQFFNIKNNSTKTVNYFLKKSPNIQRTTLQDYYDNSLNLFLQFNNLLKRLTPSDNIFKGKVFLGKKNSFIQSREGRYYIPGSSLKGAFKTAILYALLKREKDSDEPAFLDKYKKEIKELIEKYGKSKQEVFSNALLLEIFSLKEPPKVWEKHNPSKMALDFFRCVHITDAEILHDKEKKESFDSDFSGWEIKKVALGSNLQAYKGDKIDFTVHAKDIEKFNLTEGDKLSQCVTEVRGQHTRIKKCKKVEDAEKSKPKKTPEKKPLQNLISWPLVGWTTLTNGTQNEFARKKSISEQKIECFTGKTRFRVTLDVHTLEVLRPDKNTRPFNNIQDLLRITEDFAQKLWQEEKDFFNLDISTSKNLLDATKIISFYNGKSQKPSMRIGWGTGLLGMTILSLFNRSEQVRQDIRNLSSPRNGQVAPKSRRFVMQDKKPYKPLGWCKLNFISEEDSGPGDKK